MLFEHSEEGDVPGPRRAAGPRAPFSRRPHGGADGARLKVPHMGWNEVRADAAPAVGGHRRWRSRFYFVHSYFVDPPIRRWSPPTTVYGLPLYLRGSEG
jgi:glutamine amidotransferase